MKRVPRLVLVSMMTLLALSARAETRCGLGILFGMPPSTQVTGVLPGSPAQKSGIVAGDIVEVVPVPGQVVTEFLAAKLGYKIISYSQAAG